MAYAAPSITSAGLTIPTYEDILDDLIATYRGIFGQTVYLGVDSADYQWISSIALKMADTCQAIQLVYNGRSPATASGADLDAIVKCNGIARKGATFSTAALTVTGTPGVTITNGVVQDANGFQWVLPSPAVIGVTGTSVFTATCASPGAITALAASITTIATPFSGWISVTNTLPAVPGLPLELDSTLRARQALSVALPSMTRLAGTVAAIAQTSGVSRYNVLENPTGSVDSNGTPAHSITAVVEGGTDLAVATAIYNNRGIGCYVNGTTSVSVTDPNTGNTMTMRFARPTYSPVYVSLNVHSLAGYTTATTQAIKTAIAAYLNSLQIGQSVVLSELYGAALSVRPNPDAPMFSIRALTLGLSSSPSGTTDIALAYNEVAQGIAANVVITLV